MVVASVDINGEDWLREHPHRAQATLE